jgi:hypothetical protein
MRSVVPEGGRNKEAQCPTKTRKPNSSAFGTKTPLLKKGASTGIRMKVSGKGSSLDLRMGRFPVTLYKEQWLKLLSMSDDIRAFIAANEAQLKAKDNGGSCWE